MEEVCGKSIPQLEQGSKRHSAYKVCSPTVFSVSGLTFMDSPPGGAGGLTPPYPTQVSFEKGKRKERKGLIVHGEAKSGKSNTLNRVAWHDHHPQSSRSTPKSELRPQTHDSLYEAVGLCLLRDGFGGYRSQISKLGVIKRDGCAKSTPSHRR